MYIKEILNQHRRDFKAIYKCEHCQHEYTGSGYDDTYFHKSVVPAKKCPVCNQTASEDYVARETKYDDSVVI